MFLNSRDFTLETTLESTYSLTEHKLTLEFNMVESCSLFTDFSGSSEVVEALTEFQKYLNKTLLCFVTFQLMTKRT